MGARFNRSRRASEQDFTPWEKYEAAQKQYTDERRDKRPERIGQKLPQLKRQKKRQLTRRMSILIGVFGSILLLAVYFVSPLSHVQMITVTGNQVLSKQQVADFAGISKGDSIYRVIGRRKAVVKKAQTASPRLQSITFQVTHLNHLKINVKEYATAGFVAARGKYRVALSNGVVTKETRQQPSGDYPVYDQFDSQTQLRAMITQFAKLPDSLKGAISEIQFVPTKANSERIHAFMNDGNEVYATLSTFAKKMAYYPGIAAKMKANSVVNLEVGAYSYPFEGKGLERQ